MSRGSEIRARSTNKAVAALIAAINPQDLPQGFCKHDLDHQSVVIGRQELGCRGGDIRQALALASSVTVFVQEVERKYGRDVYVDAAHDYIWEVIKGRGISWNELSVYLAIRSWIGCRRRYARIARSVIIQRALGYKTKAMMEAELPNRCDGAVALNLGRAQRILNAIHERRLISRARPNPFQTYYSTSLTDTELKNRLAGGVTYVANFHQSRVSADREFMARIKSARAGNSLANVNATNVNATNAVHGALTARSPDVHQAFTLTPFTSLFPNPLTNPEYKSSNTNLGGLSETAAGEQVAVNGEVITVGPGGEKIVRTQEEWNEYMKRCKAEAGLSDSQC